MSDRKKFYFKAKKQDRIVDNLGIAPACPNNYLNQDTKVQINKSDIKTVTDSTGMEMKVNVAVQNKVKQLREKYSEYFE